MRFTKALGFTLVVLAVLFCGRAGAQTDTIGIVDTVRVDAVEGPRNGRVAVDIYLVNDEPLYAVSIPLNYNSEFLQCDTVIYADMRIAGIDFPQYKIDNQTGQVLLGGLVISSDPIAVGNDPIARTIFSISADAPLDEVLAIDSGYIHPGGEMVLTTSRTYEIFPAFVAGGITVVDKNFPPEIRTLPKQVASEGEQCLFKVFASDPENDDVTISTSRLPQGAVYDSEHNIFSWTPPYTGPNSSLGSPFEIVFSASDQNSSSHQKVSIEVINSNRPPQLSLVDSLSASEGELVEVMISVSDPDLEQVTVELEDLPAGASYSAGNPGVLSWPTAYGDHGIYDINVKAVDPYGADNQRGLKLAIDSMPACELSLSDVQVYPGETAVIALNLKNITRLSGMNLLIKYDPTIMDYLSFSREGTRIEYWEGFDLSHDQFDGRIWINAQADLPEDSFTAPLVNGEGEVLYLNFRASANTDYAGLYVPVVFDFLDTLSDGDNTFTDADGELIGNDLVAYEDGSFFIKQYQGLIGDINLNNVAFEVGDAVYYSNFFMNPETYPLTGQRLQNSDVNQDGRTATIGDLVALIRILTGELDHPGKTVAGEADLECELTVEHKDNQLQVFTDFNRSLGAMLMSVKFENERPRIITNARLENMIIDEKIEDDHLKVFVYSLAGNRISAGEEALISIESADVSAVEIAGIELADAAGNMLSASIRHKSVVPTDFDLRQNYPNPFNPSTTISFGLPSQAEVRIAVFNIRGQLVSVLADQVYPAGYHQVVWDGTDRQGSQVASGVYFYRLETAETVQSRKMLMLK